MPVVNLQHVPVRVASGRRLAQLFAGLALYGASIALQVEALLGLAPWSVLNDALTKLTGLSFGAVIAIVGVVVMLCWIPFLTGVVLNGLADPLGAHGSRGETPPEGDRARVAGGRAMSLLGGTVGFGTALYAVSIGPLTQVFLPWISWKQD